MASDARDLAKAMIAHNIYMVLSTASSDGTPWITPVYFAFDSAYRFYFVSGKDSLHAELLRQNTRASAVIFDSRAPFGTGDGVYVSGLVEELDGPSLEQGTEVFYTRRFPDASERASKGKRASDFLGDSPRRMYRLTPAHFYILDPAGHPVHGSLVDVRMEVTLT